MAIWNTTEIAAMNEEAQVRNLCRKLHQEAAEWGRSFAYRGCPVRRWQELPAGITLLCGGGKGRQWVIVERNHVQVTGKFDPNMPEELYLAIMEAAEAE